MAIKSLTLQEVITRTEDLPSMVAVALAVVQEASSESATAQSVATRLSQDAALASRVLRLANSPYYGLARQAVHVQDAVMILGMRAIRNLCLVAATYPWFARPLPGYTADPHALWAHSFATAVGSRALAQRTRKADPEDAFTAGLLHDMGKMALAACFDGKPIHFSESPEGQEIAHDVWERESLGFDHAEAGAALAQKWNLPSTIVEAARYHHQPQEGVKNVALVDVVHVAEAVSSMMGYGLTGEGLRYDFDLEALSRLGLPLDSIDFIASDLARSYEQHEKLFEEAGIGVAA